MQRITSSLRGYNATLDLLELETHVDRTHGNTLHDTGVQIMAQARAVSYHLVSDTGPYSVRSRPLDGRIDIVTFSIFIPRRVSVP